MYMKKPFEQEPEELTEQERRTIQRRHLIYYLRVWNLDGGQVLGHVVDITLEGMMLISEEPIPTGKEYSLEIRWDDTDEGPQTISFRAMSRWCKPDVNDSFYDSGFLFLDHSPEILDPIKEMITKYGFHD